MTPLEIVLAFYIRLWPLWLALAIFIIGGMRGERGLRNDNRIDFHSARR